MYIMYIFLSEYYKRLLNCNIMFIKKIIYILMWRRKGRRNLLNKQPLNLPLGLWTTVFSGYHVTVIIGIDCDDCDDTGVEMSQEIVGRFVWPPKDVVIGTVFSAVAPIYIYIIYVL